MRVLGRCGLFAGNYGNYMYKKLKGFNFCCKLHIAIPFFYSLKYKRLRSTGGPWSIQLSWIRTQDRTHKVFEMRSKPKSQVPGLYVYTWHVKEPNGSPEKRIGHRSESSVFTSLSLRRPKRHTKSTVSGCNLTLPSKIPRSYCAFHSSLLIDTATTCYFWLKLTWWLCVNVLFMKTETKFKLDPTNFHPQTCTYKAHSFPSTIDLYIQDMLRVFIQYKFILNES